MGIIAPARATSASLSPVGLGAGSHPQPGQGAHHEHHSPQPVHHEHLSALWAEELAAIPRTRIRQAS